MAQTRKPQFSVNRMTALRLLRHMRAAKKRDWSKGRCELYEPETGGAQRWTAYMFDLSRVGLAYDLPHAETFHVAVPSAKSRLRVRGVENTVYTKGLPRQAFIDVGEGLCMPCPELLFIELAADLSAFDHLLLGMELTGTYALDALDPEGGTTVYGVPPVTTLADLTAFIENTKGIKGLTKARATLRLLVENAWSPMEALMAALIVFPYDEFGYNLGPINLNPRMEGTDSTRASSRVPDIVFAGSNVGLNYDGEEHFGLKRVARAAGKLAANPGSSALQRELDTLISDAREALVADKRRGRDLAVQGMHVLSVTREDLYEQGGLDFVMLQAIDLIEESAGRDLQLNKIIACNIPLHRRARQNLLWLHLPGPQKEQARRWFELWELK